MVPIKQAQGFLTDQSLNSQEPGSLLPEKKNFTLLPAKEATVVSERQLWFFSPHPILEPNRVPWLTLQTPSLSCPLMWPTFSCQLPYQGDIIFSPGFKKNFKPSGNQTKVLNPSSNPNCLQIYSIIGLIHQTFPSPPPPAYTLTRACTHFG